MSTTSNDGPPQDPVEGLDALADVPEPAGDEPAPPSGDADPTIEAPVSFAPGPEAPVGIGPDVPPPPPHIPPPPPTGFGAPPPPPQWQPPAGAAGAVPPMPEAGPRPGVRYDVSQDQKNLAMVSTLGMLIVGFLAPLLVFVLTNGDPSKRYANDHAKEGLNFSIVFFISSIIAALLTLLLIGFVLLPLIAGWGLWVIIAGTLQASHGEAPHFPLTPKILK